MPALFERLSGLDKARHSEQASIQTSLAALLLGTPGSVPAACPFGIVHDGLEVLSALNIAEHYVRELTEKICRFEPRVNACSCHEVVFCELSASLELVLICQLTKNADTDLAFKLKCRPHALLLEESVVA